MPRLLKFVYPVPPRLLDSRIPVDLQTICLKALEKEPEARYPSAAALAEDLERYLAARGEGAPVHTIREVLRSRKFHPSVEARLVSADSATVAPEATPGCTYREEVVKPRVRAAVNRLMDTLRLDALVYPTWSNPPRLIGDMMTPAGDNSQVFSPTTGFPAITVPMGWTREGRLPAGMTFFGRTML